MKRAIARRNAASEMHAYCYRTGIIEFGEIIPDGALPIAHGSEAKLRKAVEATARHAYDGKALLVPGVPEAPDDDAALDALRGWIAWAMRNREGVTPSLEAGA